MVGRSIWFSSVSNADLKGVNGEEPAFGHVAYCEYSSLVLIQVLPPFTPLQMGWVSRAGTGFVFVAYCEYSSLVLIQILPPFTPLQMGMSVSGRNLSPDSSCII